MIKLSYGAVSLSFTTTLSPFLYSLVADATRVQDPTVVISSYPPPSPDNSLRTPTIRSEPPKPPLGVLPAHRPYHVTADSHTHALSIAIYQ